MTRSTARLTIAAVLLLLCAGVGRAEPQPSTWKRSMTADPETNYVIKRELEPLPDVGAERQRHHFLLWLVATQCRGVKFNMGRWKAFAATAPLNNDTQNGRD